MKYSIKFIKEDALTQSAIVSGNTTQEEMDNQNDEQTQVDNQVSAVTPTLQAQDVDGLEDKDVMNYVYFNAPQDIDDNTRNALFSRADQIRQKQMNGSMTTKDQEEFAKGVIAAASNSKNKSIVGESYRIGDKEIIAFILGKGKEKGISASFVWDGDDVFDEIEEKEGEGYHYYNEWIGHFDRKNKTFYLRNVVPSYRIADIAKSMGIKIVETDETRPLIDLGWEEDEEIFGEAYSSGRGGSSDEPDYPTSFYADDDETDFESFVADLAIATAEELSKEVHGDTDDITGWVYHMATQPQYDEFMRERWNKHSVWSGNEPNGADILKFKKLIYKTFIEKFSK